MWRHYAQEPAGSERPPVSSGGHGRLAWVAMSAGPEPTQELNPIRYVWAAGMIGTAVESIGRMCGTWETSQSHNGRLRV
jgi:hypothetical protein